MNFQYSELIYFYANEANFVNKDSPLYVYNCTAQRCASSGIQSILNFRVITVHETTATIAFAEKILYIYLLFFSFF